MSAYIFGIFLTAWYVRLCALFLEMFVGKSNIKKEIKYCSYTGLAVLNYILSIIFAENVLLKQIAIIVVTSIIMWIVYQHSYIKILILLLLYQASCMIIEYVTVIVVQQCFGMTKSILQSYVVGSLLGILCQMVVFCLILLMKKYFRQNSSDSLTEIEWIRFSVFPIFTMISILAMIKNFEILQNEQQGMILTLIACGLLIMNVMIFCLMNDIMKRESQIVENRLFKEKVRNETEMYHSISENYEKQRKKIHEFNNHMFCILSLVQNNEFEELKSYLDGMQADIANTTEYIDTNHTLINAILNTKYCEARKKGITFVCKVNNLSNIALVDEDIVVIFSNLINNALEACEKIENKVMTLKIIQEETQLLIAVTNTYEHVLSKDGDKFQTSKTDNIELHGIGIENVKETIAKYNGEYVIEYENQIFKFVIWIPSQGKEVLQ